MEAIVSKLNQDERDELKSYIETIFRDGLTRGKLIAMLDCVGSARKMDEAQQSAENKLSDYLSWVSEEPSWADTFGR